ncbi:hypothetical protein B0A52_00011 [Exophiala mesophila]|uniref:Ketoreductase (KR) domain-containing protein n=1 Tax=Exophiala mesophila TaxID=212818 RepID=A0A438NIU7_EXOME|nr:hypothetical protein B0A52_00011 [Exophiala mesophila]
MASMKGKVVAITGGASGIGLATAKLLAERGAQLSLADIQAKALDDVATDIEAQYGARPLTHTLDVRDAQAVDNWITQTLDKFGRLDGAANLAGVIPKSIGIKGVADQDLHEWNTVIGINLTGTMLSGLVGRPNNASYTASKHGVIGLTMAAAKEVGGNNIRVNAICPGSIETPMVDEARRISSEREGMVLTREDANEEVALKRTGKPEEVASLIAFLLSAESSYITGLACRVDGGWIC